MLSPGDRVERYEIVSALAEGGMAILYLVRHTELDTLHALKVLTLSGEVLKDRLRSEGRVQARLRHENVIRVSDVVQVGKMPALVMDYVDGPDLHGWIRAVHPDPELAEQVFRGIVAGVEAAHAAGLVHRDLKPANVLMSQHPDGGWVPRVTDFGIVKLLSEPGMPARTLSNVPLGTPEYMSPEQIRDPSRVDHRADLFSLGCILFELLAGHPAFSGTDMLTVFQAIEGGDHPPLPPGIPPRLIRVIDACLAHDPNDRPADCAAILAMLDQGAAAPRVAPTGALHPALVALGLAAAAFVLMVSMGSVAVLVWWTWPAPGGLEPGPGREAAPLLPNGPSASPIEPVVDAPVPSRTQPSRTPALPPEEEEEPLPEPPAPEVPRQPEVVDGPCPGIRGEVVGWFEARPVKVLGVDPPTLGRVYDVSVQRTVYSEPPRPSNGGQPGEPVCKLSPGTRIRIERAPIRDGRSYWVPFVAGTIVPE